MRKHHTRWVALLGAATLSTTGLTGLAGPAVAADDKDPRVINWPVVEQAVSSYRIDGFEIGYLPPGLDRFGLNASSLTDRRGNSQSQISWVQGPDQLYGRVMILRSERVQTLEDLRDLRYAHLPDRGLERMEGGEGSEREAYVSESTGDMFWLEEPGVAVTIHLRPERWNGDELRRMAESVVGAFAPDAEGASEEAQEDVQNDTGEAGESTGTGESEAAEENGETAEVEAPEQATEAVEAEAAEEAAGTGEAEEAEEPAQEASVEEVAGSNALGETGGETAEAGAEQAPAQDAAVGEQEDTDAVEVTAEEVAAVEVPAEDGDAVEVTAEDVAATGGDASGAEEADTGSDQPETTSSRRVKECLIDEFVVFDYTDAEQDRGSTSAVSGDTTEQPLSRAQLTDEQRDELLATVWYHGTEVEKNAATDHCADSLDMRRSDIEAVLAEIADLIARLIEEAEAKATEGMEEIVHSATETHASGPGEAGGLEPMDDAEWEELWNSLPWSFEMEVP
ncbi:hypothetical protein [Nocardiopsis sp. FIRDI 009]|uniref:hypothetical protein n=1 Tax=Nocardiopsis sp. FIRDI 009 TaxID=714197 RepID=UPI00130094E9|nr:hypothetical protein [Nocardiopsis sp. FIRDI 009]